MLRAAIVGIVVVAFASVAGAECPPGKPCNDPKSVPTAKPMAPARAAPKRADSCDTVRKREADLVKRLAAAEKRIAELEAQQQAEIRRLQEQNRKLNTQLK